MRTWSQLVGKTRGRAADRPVPRILDPLRHLAQAGARSTNERLIRDLRGVPSDCEQISDPVQWIGRARCCVALACISWRTVCTGGTVAASELIEVVSDIVTRHRPGVPPLLAAEFDVVARRLREPLRVAVVGRVKAGKSTMVNALLGQRVAPTDVSECTRVVTWFHYGHPQRLAIELRDGRFVQQQLAAGAMLPANLGAPVGQVVALHVYLANQALKSFTLIDTPGLGSVHPEYSASTEELLSASASSKAAIDRADAIVYLMNQVILEDELAVLNSLGESDEDDTTSAARTLGVLGRADQLGDGTGDPWQVAVELAGQYAGLLQDQLSEVVPVIGLLAETTEAASLTERDAQTLARLAELSPAELTKLTWTADRFRSAESAVPAAERVRLLDLLALYGVRLAVALVQKGTVGATALRRELGDASGIRSVKQSLGDLVGERDYVLKTRSALAALNRIAYRAELGQNAAMALRNDIDRVRTSAVMQPIAEIEAWQAVLGGRIALPPELHEDLRALVTPGGLAGRLRAESADADELRAATKAALVRWRTFLNAEATPAQQTVARTVLRSYQFIWGTLP